MTKRPMIKGVVVCPLMSNEISGRGQVDFIIMLSMSPRTCRWIMADKLLQSAFSRMNAFS